MANAEMADLLLSWLYSCS